jgi:hypothetical protein
MRSFIVATSLLLVSAASAAAPSMLCKATDVEQYYNVIAPEKGKVLFQIDGGTFLEGLGQSIDSKVLAISVNATNGNIYMVVDLNNDRGLVRIEYKDGRAYQHPITCLYR